MLKAEECQIVRLPVLWIVIQMGNMAPFLGKIAIEGKANAASSTTFRKNFRFN